MIKYKEQYKAQDFCTFNFVALHYKLFHAGLHHTVQSGCCSPMRGEGPERSSVIITDPQQQKTEIFVVLFAPTLIIVALMYGYVES